jgi:beta-glucosidase
MPRHLRTPALTAALLASFLAASAGAAPASLPLYVGGKAMPGSRVLFGDFDVQAPLAGDTGRMAQDPKLPGAVVQARRADKDGRGDALALEWKNAWFATLRIEGAPLDLRPYLAHGTLSFDLKVDELAKGGLAYRLECGDDCERTITDVIPARAAQGQGWRHLRYALSCFHRDGDDVRAVTRPFALDGTGEGKVEIANIRIDAAGTPNTACPDYRTASVTPAPLQESWALDWWMPRHEEKLAEIARRKAAGERTELVFLGDSITHNWEKDAYGKRVWDERYARYHPLDLGYGGDRTENLLWRLQHGEVDGIAPKVAVLMIGTNNTGLRHDAPSVIYAGIARDIEELRRRLPHTTILLLAIFPRGERADDGARRSNEAVNALLPQLADGRQVRFLNINGAFLRPDGSLSRDIMPDLLHPNERGYRIWADAMQPALERLMGDAK